MLPSLVINFFYLHLISFILIYLLHLHFVYSQFGIPEIDEIDPEVLQRALKISQNQATDERFSSCVICKELVRSFNQVSVFTFYLIIQCHYLTD